MPLFSDIDYIDAITPIPLLMPPCRHAISHASQMPIFRQPPLPLLRHYAIDYAITPLIIVFTFSLRYYATIFTFH
jgi:hypothetical protein